METILFKAVIFSLPCWAANISFNFTFFLKDAFPALRRIDGPLDRGAKLFGRPVFGPSRTVLGLLIALSLACTWGLFSMDPLDPMKIMLTFAGALSGSFIKRRFDVPSHTLVPILDHADYMILIGSIFYFLSLESGAVIAVSIILTVIGHPLFCRIGYWMGIKEKPY